MTGQIIWLIVRIFFLINTLLFLFVLFSHKVLMVRLFASQVLELQTGYHARHLGLFCSLFPFLNRRPSRPFLYL